MPDYRQLKPDRIVQTTERLAARIGERFPEASLYRVARELVDVARVTEAHVDELRQPMIWIRVVNVLLICLLILGLTGVVISGMNTDSGELSLIDWITLLEAGINDVVLIGLGIFFLVTLEGRFKRAKALRSLHEFRSLAHVIDMHQLTKDPELSMFPIDRTPSSPIRDLTNDQLARYLDYCTEMLAIIGKLSALFAQQVNDSVVLASVTEIENLAAALSRKIWQKLTMIQRGPVDPAN